MMRLRGWLSRGCPHAPQKGISYQIHADLVLAAVGQATDLGALARELATGEGQTITADPVTQTSNVEGVFAGGDVVTGPATVVEAFGAGKRAAQSIDRYLQGLDLAPNDAGTPAVGKPDAAGNAEQRPRAKEQAQDPAIRVNNFDEIVSTLTAEQAVAEAERCLGCGVYGECLWAASARNRQSQEKTVLVTLEVDAQFATQVAGIRVQSAEVSEPIETVMPPETDDDVVVCRCERVTLGQVRRAIRAGVRDMNQLKAMLKVGFGACGGKTCGPLIRALFRQEGVPADEVTELSERPLVAETALGLFAGVTPEAATGEEP